MALEKLTKDLDIIQKLDDEPNDVSGLTAQELKEKFDESGNSIKTFLNETLIPNLEHLGVETAVLLPENDAYSPIDGTYAQIPGKVAAVVRRY